MAYGYRRYPQYGPQGGGFYNPYQKGPAWGQGIQQFMQNLMQYKEMQRQAEERARRASIEEREMKRREDILELEKKPKAEKPSALDREIAHLMAAGHPYDKAVELATLGRPPQPRVTGKTPEEEQYSRDTKYTNVGIRRLEKEQTRIQRQFDKFNEDMSMVTKDTPDEDWQALQRKWRKTQTRLTNTKDALQKLYEGQTYLSYGKPYGLEVRGKVERLTGDLNYVMSGKFREPEPERKQFKNKKTGKLEWFVLKGGKWVKE